MKKSFLFLLAFLVMGTSITYAQDNSKAIKKSIKSSSKALKKYKLDPTNTAKLDDAKSAVESAMKMQGADAVGDLYLAKANIYQFIAQNELSSREQMRVEAQIKGGKIGEAVEPVEITYNFENPTAAITAFEAYSKALEMTEKSSSRAKIVKELEVTSRHLNDIGLYSYENKDYKSAYMLFDNLVKSNALVQSNGGKPLLDETEKVDNMTFYAALAAQYADMNDEALIIYKKMYDGGSKKIEVYDALYKANLESDETAAIKYLEEGRAIDPENINLLFSEINYYLKKGEYVKLESKLKEAMDKEPDNASLRAVMGNVYNDFYKKEKDAEKAKEYFKKAEDYYGQSLKIDAESFEALYSLGELNYNRAAGMVSKYNDMPITASQKDVDALKVDYLAAFDKALPYFLKADGLNGKDYNTILALKEIYAKKDNFAKSNEYKARLETLK